MKKLRIIFLLFCLLIPVSFVACKNENKNTLSAPTNLYVENGVVIFNKVQEAENYILNINDLVIYLNPDYNNNITLTDNKINYNANKIFSVGESYSIKVKSIASGKVDSKYTNPISYKHQAEISTPENVTINGTTLTWNVVKNASFYMVKIATPLTTIDLDDNISIANADIPEYSFHINSFNFSSLLSEAGEYRFYVCAVKADDANYVYSEYSNKTSYIYTNKLANPKIGTIKEVSNELHLQVVVDSNTEALEIFCNGQSKEIEINDANGYVIERVGNSLNLNLNKIFATNASEDVFEKIKQYEFKVKALNKSKVNFYLNSDYSNTIAYEKTLTLSAPVLSLEEDTKNNAYLASWECSNTSNVSKYVVYVASETGINEYQVDNTTNNLLITETNFYCVFVQAIGSGNYLNSNYSNITSINNSAVTFSVNKSTNNNILTLTFTNHTNSYYLIEYLNNHIHTNSNTYQIDLSNSTLKEFNIKISLITENGFTSSTLLITHTKKLAAPEISASQGFSSNNPYLLTFTPVKDAMGYLVYIKSNEEDSEYQQIDTIYTTTSINLTQFVISENSSIRYYVKIKAIADLNSNVEDSDFSREIEVAQKRVLAKPIATDVNNPISTDVTGNKTSYYLNFHGVADADSYEILINYNKITIINTNESIYSVDVSKYLTAANKYEIKIRAISNSEFISPSEYSVYNYTLHKQLPEVENIEIAKNNEIYTLSFTPVENAASYSVRIVKVGDADYSHPELEIYGACDVTPYITEKGEYHFFITANPVNSYYLTSNESSNYGVISKLTNLKAPNPETIKLENTATTSYVLSWEGDVNADYYELKITDPNSFENTFKVDKTNFNLYRYFTIQGDYSIEITSMIRPNSESSKLYIQSTTTTYIENYTYENDWDFERYSVYMYGEKTDFKINSVQELKNILWYNYLYEINADYKLPLYIVTNTNESVKDAIIKLANEAETKELYAFSQDTTWTTNYTNATSTKTETETLNYVCQKLINLYPEMHILSTISMQHTDNSNTFKLYYNNQLNGKKVKNTLISTVTADYNNYFEYLPSQNRRSANSLLDIDTLGTTMLVETTEQLLHAVENGYRPVFYGENSEDAENVYSNAKKVLKSINSKNMSDLEKATRIYEWLSYSHNLNLYATKTKAGNNTTLEDAKLSVYGKREEFYLESIFLNLSSSDNGSYDGEFYLDSRIATSASFSKAFTLLCRMEGIETITVNGTINGEDHNWNKIKVKAAGSSKKWYVVDIAKSSEKVKTSNLTSTSMASYKYFLVTDVTHKNALTSEENLKVISTSYANKPATTDYNIYANINFEFTKQNLIDAGITNISNLTFEADPTSYYKIFDFSKTYYKYNSATQSLGQKESYILNIIMYAQYTMNVNEVDKLNFEFSFDVTQNGNNSDFGLGTKLASYINSYILASYQNTYNFTLTVESAEQTYNETTNRTIVNIQFAKT